MSKVRKVKKLQNTCNFFCCFARIASKLKYILSNMKFFLAILAFCIVSFAQEPNVSFTANNQDSYEQNVSLENSAVEDDSITYFRQMRNMYYEQSKLLSTLGIFTLIGSGLGLGIGGVLLLSTMEECGECGDGGSSYNDDSSSSPEERKRTKIGVGLVLAGLSLLGGSVAFKVVSYVKFMNGELFNVKMLNYESRKNMVDIRFSPMFDLGTRAFGGVLSMNF